MFCYFQGGSIHWDRLLQGRTAALFNQLIKILSIDGLRSIRMDRTAPVHPFTSVDEQRSITAEQDWFLHKSKSITIENPRSTAIQQRCILLHITIWILSLHQWARKTTQAGLIPASNQLIETHSYINRKDVMDFGLLLSPVNWSKSLID